MLSFISLIYTFNLKITTANYESKSSDVKDSISPKDAFTSSNTSKDSLNTSKDSLNNTSKDSLNTSSNKYENQLKSSPLVVLYKKYCPYSMDTLSTLTRLKYDFTKFEKSEYPELAEYVKTNIYPKYPAIFLDGKFFGGNDVLQDALRNNKFYKPEQLKISLSSGKGNSLKSSIGGEDSLKSSIKSNTPSSISGKESLKSSMSSNTRSSISGKDSLKSSISGNTLSSTKSSTKNSKDFVKNSTKNSKNPTSLEKKKRKTHHEENSLTSDNGTSSEDNVRTHESGLNGGEL